MVSNTVHLPLDPFGDAKLQKKFEKQVGIIRKNSEKLGNPKKNFVNL